MVSVFLSAGITALVYRFLGGIRNASFAVGALKLGGTIAALIGIAFWIDSTKELNPRFHLVSTDMILGDWEWDYAGPGMGWNGHIEFEKKNGQLTFIGKEYNVVKAPEGKHNVLLHEMTNGKAELIGGTYLSLESDVKDHQYSRNFHWKSVEPLTITPAFLGRLRPTGPSDQNLESEPYGMLIYKKTNSP